MQEVNKDYANETVAAQGRNFTALVGVGIMNLIIVLAYLIEVFKGARSIGSYALVALGCIVPTVLAIMTYIRNKESGTIRYITSIGFLILYTYILFTKSTNLTFVYAVVIFIILTVYVDTKLSVGLGVAALVINIVQTSYKGLTVGLAATEVTEMEIIVACLILAVVFMIMSLSKISQINAANIEKAEAQKKQSEELLQTILKVADQLADGVGRANGQTENLKSSLELTQKEMESLSESTNDTANAIMIQQQKTEVISTRIQEVGTVTDSIINNVRCTEENLMHGQQLMKNLIEQVEQSEKASKLVVREMTELKEYADKMQDIMALIRNVASQTGLLSLNASIEAARAGEAGRGFAVVASEISNLAGQTSSATEDINNLINNITQLLRDVSASIEGMLENNKKQNVYVNDTAENFKEIHNSTQEIFQTIDKLKETVDAVGEANETIIDSVSNVSALTEEVTASANETFEESKRNMQSVDDIVQIIDMLNKNAEELWHNEISAEDTL